MTNIPVTEQNELREQLAQFKDANLDLMSYGPDFDRSTLTNYRDALFCANKGDLEAARYFYRLARESAEKALNR